MVLEKLKNIELIDLVTHPKNKKSVELYNSLGFKRVRQQQENYFGDSEPKIRMVLKK